MSIEKKETTDVETVDVNLSEILGTGAEQVMTSAEETKKKPSIFSPINPDTTFLDKFEPAKKEEKTPEEIAAEEEANKDKTPEEIQAEKEATELKAKEGEEDPLAPPHENEEEEESEKNKGGRPTIMVGATKKLIDKGLLLPFDDDKKLEDYTEEDFIELLESNFKQQETKLSKDLPAQFFGQMPEEMQQAYEYLASGGTDIKGMFGALAASTEMKELDISNENGQKEAIRAYLQATQWGTPEEIEDEIYSLEDSGNLDKKAKQFKPKLDAMQQQIVNKKLIDQQIAQKQRAEQSQKYMDSVYSTLEEGKLNNIDLDTKTQNMLYAGLVQSNYPSISGKQTNMLGHLLEKYQWVEPRHDLIAEALWLLADPDGYRKSIGNKVEIETNKKTLRTLKTEEGNKGNGSQQYKEPEQSLSRKRKGLERPKKNFFARH